jgi:hypothetical protein
MKETRYSSVPLLCQVDNLYETQTKTIPYYYLRYFLSEHFHGYC